MSEVRFDAKGRPLRRFRLRLRTNSPPGATMYAETDIHSLRRPSEEKVQALLPELINGLTWVQFYFDPSTGESEYREVSVAPPLDAIRTILAHSGTCSDIIDHFLAGTPPERMTSLFNQGKTSGNYYGRYTGMRAGEWRTSYNRDFLFSYGMPLGCWVQNRQGEPVFLINGDGAPSPTTRAHQSILRERFEELDHSAGVVRIIRPHAIIPFDILTQAGLNPQKIQILDMTPARFLTRESPVTKATIYDHFLGEALFQDQLGATYLSGLDRNDNARRRSFYLCKVTNAGAATKPETVEEALTMLRPAGLPEDTKRQGEWFFVPVPGYKPSKGVVRGPRLPIVSARPSDQRAEMVLLESGGYAVPRREGRHVASSMAVDETSVYVKGVIHDREHTACHLGQTWHRVVQNLAIVGWRYDNVRLGSHVD